eukprot:CAMPEP_0179312206 /NCGR_PEP_ID=MMETSP0797-20121207/53127_1 /TAXON_ID=47934 /ORGANISM="Dinophysis acuminata, Strain DAEP01" /LENGTH=56 /DNA_ID=CAMNT_0021022093 /DNA_START=1 /DNA_END=171 /DNA_ORIENTATION=+
MIACIVPSERHLIAQLRRPSVSWSTRLHGQSAQRVHTQCAFESCARDTPEGPMGAE